MKKLFAFTILIGSYFMASSQTSTQYPEIPRIDVHTHPENDYVAIKNYIRLREVLKEEYAVDFAFWINVSGRDPIHNLDSVMLMSENRSLACIADFSPHRELTYKPEDLKDKMEEGYTGYKIWYGTKSRVLKPGEKGYPYVDDPHNDPILSKMEELGMVAASMHIADPNGPFGNRTKWCPDPVEYWKMIRAFTNMLEKHPNLVVVGAHAFWLMCQDAQIDYLRYILATYPNVYIDLAATYQYQNMVNYDNLRSFMIEYSDRILFGTDAGKWHSEEEVQSAANAYSKSFRILETDQLVEGSFFGDEPTKGLNLPEEVLENIYYKNALKIYPGLKEKMAGLGYKLE
jgi:predicted TIM-barrel fold metal-dependent hydrolase